MATAAVLIASCSPGEGPESIPLPTSPNTTTTTTTTTPPTTTTTLVPPRYEATIRRTTDGVAHITGSDAEDVAYGQGWVSGQDHGCTLVDQVIKVLGQRAATFGPGTEGENVESDFAWRAIEIASIAARDFEDTASSEVVELFEAFTAGWNDQLADTGGEQLTGWCAGADWVRALEPVEVYTYARAIALQASGSRLLDFIASAQPPTADPVGIRRAAMDLDAFAEAGDALSGGGPGSNAWAIGRDRVEGAEGSLLFANPHFPWEGELRFTEAHLTVPGEFDVYGAQLLGVPGLAIGFTDGVAWTHTVSAGKRMTGYNLTLDPESPTSYLVDGVSVPMIAAPTTIEILRPDGTIDTETRTMWRSEYGPIIDFPGIGWTTTNVLTYRDANITNDEFVEQYARLATIDSIDDLAALNAEYQGVPLFNTVAADSNGDVWYADTSATPNLSAEAESLYLEQLFTDPLTQFAYDAGFVLLDGSDSRFRWEVVPGARDPGLVPFADMPMTTRSDHVFNANDSFWVPNADTTLTGPYSILHGEQRSALSMRTRQNTAVLGATNRAGLAGPDDLFSADEVRTAAFDNTARTALLLRPSAVEACQVFPLVDVDEVLADDGSVSLPAATVDVTAACRVLAGWDGVYDLDRAGPIIWREMMAQFPDDAFTGPGPLFADGFDPADPTTTPSVPATDLGPLLRSMARAVQVISEAGFADDTTLGAAQFTERSDTRIPIHGGLGAEGITNVVSWSRSSSSSEPVPERGEPVAAGSSLRGEGYRINFGTSFVMVVDYTGDEVEASALLVYGQTGDRTSELFDVQTRRFSDKQWREVAFTEDQIEADPNLTTDVVLRP